LNRLADKTALITGGTAGIGRATAALFAQEGARVIITGRDEGRGHAAIADLRQHGGVDFLLCDVRDPEQCQRTVDETIRRLGQLDILFNNAGIVPFGTVLETSNDVWRDVWETNVSGTFYMSRAALPSMIERGRGVIVNNCSDWGVVGGQNAAAYATTKGAVALLTKSLALDHARQGIRVNAVCPGDTAVERWRSDGRAYQDFEAYLRNLGAAFPLGRVGAVEEIARAVMFLASDESSYITGHLLLVDGGNTAGGGSTRY
jgi:meso-butanediol dehydrogenase / (S,S)-butanediol dehydrogenase / diacetyl reductase